MITTTRRRWIRSLAGTAAAVLVGTLGVATPAQAASLNPSVGVHCDPLDSSFICDGYEVGFASIANVEWDIDGWPRREFHGQWNIFDACYEGDHLTVDFWVQGRNSIGTLLWRKATTHVECSCEEAH
jgi:hypothetical protein